MVVHYYIVHHKAVYLQMPVCKPPFLVFLFDFANKYACQLPFLKMTPKPSFPTTRRRIPPPQLKRNPRLVRDSEQYTETETKALNIWNLETNTGHFIVSVLQERSTDINAMYFYLYCSLNIHNMTTRIQVNQMIRLSKKRRI